MTFWPAMAGAAAGLGTLVVRWYLGMDQKQNRNCQIIAAELIVVEFHMEIVAVIILVVEITAVKSFVVELITVELIMEIIMEIIIVTCRRKSTPIPVCANKKRPLLSIQPRNKGPF